MSDADVYYLRYRGRVTGPFPRKTLAMMRELGRLTPIHEVSADRVTWFSTAEAGLIAMPVADDPVPGGDLSLPYSEEPVPILTEVSSAGGAVSDFLADQAPAGGAPDRWYYLDAARNRVGPMTFEDVIAAIAGGTVVGHTQVWADSLNAWTTVDKTALAAHLPKRPGGDTGKALVPLGYLLAVLGLVLFPLFGVVGLVCGLIHLANRRVGHGVAQVLLSLACTAGGVALWVMIWAELTKQPG